MVSHPVRLPSNIREITLVVCPLCKSEDVQVVYSVTNAEAAQHWKLKEHDPAGHRALSDKIEALWGQKHAESMLCHTCDFGFSSPFVAGDESFYMMAHGASRYPKDKWEFTRAVELLKPRMNNDFRVLEIGSGYGFFLDKLVSVGLPPANAWSLEYNDTARDKLEAKGYRVFLDGLPALIALGEQFDAVCMFQVLEHSDNLDVLLPSLKSVLRPGGEIIFAVPNAKQVRFQEEHDSLLDMPPNHISRWSETSFRQLAGNNAMVLNECSTEPFSLLMFAKQDAIYAYARKAQKGAFLISSVFNKRSSTVGRLANMSIAAIMAVGRIPVWIKARGQARNLGPNLLVRLRSN